MVYQLASGRLEHDSSYPDLIDSTENRTWHMFQVSKKTYLIWSIYILSIWGHVVGIITIGIIHKLFLLWNVKYLLATIPSKIALYRYLLGMDLGLWILHCSCCREYCCCWSCNWYCCCCCCCNVCCLSRADRSTFALWRTECIKRSSFFDNFAISV